LIERRGRMEGRLERLERLVESLVKEFSGLAEEVKELKNVLERLLCRRLRVEEVEEGRVLLLSELSKDELGVVKEFLDWMRENWKEWVKMYEEGYMEGFDSRAGRLCLRRDTVEKFLERAYEKGYVRRDVLRVLGDVGLLRYRVVGRGRRQYCIAVRISKPVRTVVSRYIVDIERAKEISEELRRMKDEELVDLDELVKEEPVDEEVQEIDLEKEERETVEWFRNYVVNTVK
jgi:hypothetical protein